MPIPSSHDLGSILGHLSSLHAVMCWLTYKAACKAWRLTKRCQWTFQISHADTGYRLEFTAEPLQQHPRLSAEKPGKPGKRDRALTTTAKSQHD